MAHILMVLDHTFPPDLRVENEAATLAKAGFEVTVLSIGPDSRDSEEVVDGYRIVRDRISRNSRNKMRGLAGTIPFLDLYLVRLLKKLYLKRPFDAIHAHDLYLFGACLHAGRKLGLPVVGDMHENWPDALKHYHWSTHFPGRCLVSPRRWDRLETDWSLAVDELIVVIEEMADRLSDKGIPRDKLTVVPNTISLLEFGSYPVDAALARSIESDLTLVYTGGMDHHRGIRTAIEAMPAILESVPGARMVLVGDGAVRNQLKELGERLGLDESVTFTGWQPQNLIRSYIAGSDIGIIPHVKTVQNDHGLPHKLFHYMYMGLPIVASDCRPLRRIIETEMVGLIFRSGDAADFARCVLELARDPALMHSMGGRGKSAVEERYHWEATSKGLTECYRRLFDRH